jgi:hypothetical protein
MACACTRTPSGLKAREMFPPPYSLKGCTVLHTGLISCSTGTSIHARGPDCPALGSQRGSSYHELRTLLPPNKSYQVRLASVEPRTSCRHVRHNFITSEGEIPVQCLTTEPRPDDIFPPYSLPHCKQDLRGGNESADDKARQSDCHVPRCWTCISEVPIEKVVTALSPSDEAFQNELRIRGQLPLRMPASCQSVQYAHLICLAGESPQSFRDQSKVNCVRLALAENLENHHDSK